MSNPSLEIKWNIECLEQGEVVVGYKAIFEKQAQNTEHEKCETTEGYAFTCL